MIDLAILERQTNDPEIIYNERLVNRLSNSNKAHGNAGKKHCPECGSARVVGVYGRSESRHLCKACNHEWVEGTARRIAIAC